MFWLALKTGFLTVITLGFYRFWMKTRLRRFFWSAIRPGGHPLEYTGDPFEKLLGFFIAVVILTFYIGIFNLLLMFVSFSVFEGTGAGYLASFIGVIPLWFYARYRAQRYVLGRTRWRGVRFALEPAAWRYTGHALWHWGLTIVSLGALWPRMTFKLEKFRTDRTVFGDLRLEQRGSWTQLYRAAYPLIAGLIAGGLYALWLGYWQPVVGDLWTEGGLLDQIDNIETLFGSETPVVFNAPERLWWSVLLVFWVLYGMVYYANVSKRIMANHKYANDLRLHSELKPARIFMIYVLGYTLAYLVFVIGIIVLLLSALAFFGVDQLFFDMDNMMAGLEDWPRWLALSMLTLLYFGVFLLWTVMFHTFVTFPRLRHLAQTLCLFETAGLADVSQRARDSFAEAEGFAEALDLGAAI